MFTAELTGCSFGVGMPGPNGERRVVHANAADKATQDDTTPQVNRQLRMLQRRVGGGQAVQPRHYRMFDMETGVEQRATILGVRKGNGRWEFWFQTVQSDLADKRILKVQQFA